MGRKNSQPRASETLQTPPQVPETDEESTRLLAEMEENAKKETQVDELGADNSEPPASVKQPRPHTGDPRAITNCSKNPHRIGGTTVPVGGLYYLTNQDLTNKRLMQKVDYAIKLKVLSRGAD